MRLLFLPALALLLLFAACSDNNSDSATADPSPTTTSGPAASLGPAEFDGTRALAHVEMLSKTIGPRVSGTDEEDRAVDYIAGQFEQWGYSVERMNFTFDGDRFNREGTVKSTSSEFQGLALAGSMGGTAAGTAAFVGLADAAGIGNQDLAGRVAIADRGTVTFKDKYENVARAGAAALVIINNQTGDFSGDLRVESSIPVLAVKGEDGPALKALVGSGERLTITTPQAGKTESVNVIARATAGGDCKVLVGGHHDTVPAAPGANDNASGTGAVLELARALAADGLDGGLCFATFGAEESGLFGSNALAREMEKDGTLPDFYVNIDVAGIGEGVQITASPELLDAALGFADALGIHATEGGLPANTGSDHQSFDDVGVPVIFIWSTGDFDIHTPNDTFETIQVDELDRVGDLNQKVIADLLA